MSNIAILSQQLTNMIAAGEVVERPLQVVKELVENSIDAKAKNIEITLKTGGIEFIGIKDDGCGIAYDQLPLAFMRHATSKINDVSQLFQIETMGFRGEALPSIASVAKVTCDSNDGKTSGRYVVDNGEVITHQPIDCDLGTHIRVEHLFAKVPARLKHLKNDHYEQSLIVNTIQKMALINLNIAFTLIADDQILFESDGKGNIENTIFAIYGKAVTQSLMHFKEQQFDIAIQGVIAASQFGRSNKNQITLSLNGRYIRPNKLMAVILSAIKQYYPEGKYPILVLNVSMEYALVDVNVHPSKLEVRISKENQLESMVFNALEATLRQSNTYIEYAPIVDREPIASSTAKETIQYNHQQVNKPSQMSLDFSVPLVNPSSTAKETIQYNHQQVNKPSQMSLDFSVPLVNPLVSNAPYQPHPQPKESAITPIVETVNEVKSQFNSSLTNKSPLTLIGQMHGKFILASDESGLVIAITPIVETVNEVKSQFNSSLTNKSPLTLIGQMHGKFILASDESGLVIIDQHAAQERVHYEQIRSLMLNNKQSYPLLSPILIPFNQSNESTLHFVNQKVASIGLKFENFGNNEWVLREVPSWAKDIQQAQFYNDLINDVLFVNQKVASIGLKFENFGNNEWVLREVPSWAKDIQQAQFYNDLINDVLLDKSINLEEVLRDKIASKACKSSIKFNQYLDLYQQQQVIKINPLI